MAFGIATCYGIFCLRNFVTTPAAENRFGSEANPSMIHTDALLCLRYPTLGLRKRIVFALF